MAYVEYPHSGFPEAICNLPNMEDVTAMLRPVVDQYTEAWMVNDLNTMAQLKNQYPGLDKSLFNADKFNILLDEMKATQKFFKDDVDAMIAEVAQHTIGIKDDASGNEKKTNTYSAEKIDALISRITGVKEVFVPSSGWSSSAPYTQNISVSGVLETDRLIIGIYIQDGTTPADVKAQTKAYSCVDRVVSGAGKLTVYCYNKKPVTDFRIQMKGVN